MVVAMAMEMVVKEDVKGRKRRKGGKEVASQFGCVCAWAKLWE